MRDGNKPTLPLGCAAIVLVMAVLFVGAMIFGSSDNDKSSSLGDTVYISSGSAAFGAGITRSAFSEATKAATAGDRVGFGELVASGDIVILDDCQSGLLIDSAFAGERQVRLADGSAVWVDSSWLKSSASDCG